MRWFRQLPKGVFFMTTALLALFFASCEAGVEPAQRDNVYDPHGSNWGGARPSVHIVSPTNGEVLASIFKVRGTAADDLGLSNINIIVAGVLARLPLGGTSAEWTNSYNSAAIGDTLIEAYSEDFGGNASVTDRVRVYVDVTIPLVEFIYPAEDLITRTAPLVIIGYSIIPIPYAITNVAIETNSGGWAQPVGTMTNWTYSTVLNEGTNTFRARVLATSLRTNFTPVRTVVLDTTPPVIALSNLINYQYCSDNFDFKGSVYEPYAGLSNLYVNLDGGPYSVVPVSGGLFNTNISLAPRLGLHTNRFFAVDNLGNTSATDMLIMEYTEMVPSVSIIGPSNYFTSNQPSVLVLGTNTVGAFFSITNVMLRVNGGLWTAVSGCNPQKTEWSNQTVLSPDVTNAIEVVAQATSGFSNISSVSVIYDTTPPKVSNLTPFPYLTNAPSLTVNVSITDALSGVRTNFYSVNGGASNGFYGASFNAAGMGPGTNVILVWSADNAGNVSAQIELTNCYDNNPPAFSVTGPSDYAVFGAATFPLTGTVSDGYGMQGVYVFVNGGPTNWVNPLAAWTNYPAIAYGTNAVSVFARDAAGNDSPVTNLNVVRSSRVYVSPGGSDANSGLTWDQPLLSIQKALDLARSNSITNVFVRAGVYTPGNGLNPSSSGFAATNFPFRISGGWDPSFSAQSGMSELDGLGLLSHVAFLSNITGGSMDGFVMRGGAATNAPTFNSRGGGLAAYSVHQSLLSNIILSNNLASLQGGGIYMFKANSNRIFMDASGNTANGGGGFAFNSCCYSGITGSFMSNKGGSSGGVYFSSAISNSISGAIGYNTANMGGGIFLSGYSNLLAAQVFSNSASNKGGGVYIQGNENTVTGPVMSNAVTGDGVAGGGIYINGDSNTVSNLTGYNYSAYNGGGISLSNANNNVIASTVFSNCASNNGGGIYLYSVNSNLITGSVIGNITITDADSGYGNGVGSGMFLNMGVSNRIEGFFSGNTGGSEGSEGVDGAVIMIFNAKYSLVSCVTTNNVESYTVYIENNSSNTVLSNCVLASAPGNGDTAVFCWSGPGLRMVNNTFVSNGFLYLFGGSHGVVYNNAAWTNINVPSFTGATPDSTNNVRQ